MAFRATPPPGPGLTEGEADAVALGDGVARLGTGVGLQDRNEQPVMSVAATAAHDSARKIGEP